MFTGAVLPRKIIANGVVIGRWPTNLYGAKVAQDWGLAAAMPRTTISVLSRIVQACAVADAASDVVPIGTTSQQRLCSTANGGEDVFGRRDQ